MRLTVPITDEALARLRDFVGRCGPAREGDAVRWRSVPCTRACAAMRAVADLPALLARLDRAEVERDRLRAARSP